MNNIHNLRVAPDWNTQIEQIRNRNTEDTNLIRFGNDFYRKCRNNNTTFGILLNPSTGEEAKKLFLILQTRDLYITHINRSPFVGYSKTLDQVAANAPSLDSSIHTLSANRPSSNLYNLQSLIVFCVAESLRSDYVATKVSQMISASMISLRGVPIGLQMLELLRIAHQWKNSSDAIFNSLSPQAKTILVKPRALLSQAERRFYERVDVERIPADFRRFANAFKVLKIPG
jgi:hypothetical protein